MQALRLVNTEDIEWRDVPSFEGLYKVSSIGEIQSIARNGTKGGLLKKAVDRYGYEKVVLRKNDKPHYFTVHRIVALAFIPRTEDKFQVNHINALRTDNRVENLEWVTLKENIYHSHALGNQTTIMVPIVAINISTQERKVFGSQREAARELNLSQGNITRVLAGIYKQTNGYKFERN